MEIDRELKNEDDRYNGTALGLEEMIKGLSAYATVVSIA